MAATSIGWTNYSWNPIVAENRDGKRGHLCVKISPGCSNCYAEKINLRLGTGATYTNFGRVENQVVDLLSEKALLEPLSWRKPRMVFVCSMTDLFGDWVPDEWIDRIFAVMARCEQHTFQVLTKRPKRMQEYLSDPGNGQDRSATRYRIGSQMGIKFTQRMGMTWPLPNVWCGTSVEDQRNYDYRSTYLENTPAAVRWLSCEPLLGQINLDLDGIGWVVVGGESGPKARPCHVDWIQGIVNQCVDDGVKVFVKQMGRHVLVRDEDLYRWKYTRHENHDREIVRVHLRSSKGDDPAEWPEDLRIQEWPATSTTGAQVQ